MADLAKTYLFRMSHIDNISHIWEHGITKIDSANANKDYKSIGDGSLINNRALFLMPNGMTLGNYIPFYFWYRMPMLYVIQKGFNEVNPVTAENIVYCVSSVAEIINQGLDYVFTDGHGIDSFTSFYSSEDSSRIDELLDFDAIRIGYWVDEIDTDKKRRKEAEFLVVSDIPNTAILGYVVYNQIAKEKLVTIGIPENIIHIKTNYYF